jgi:nicotinamidase-related amidase
MRGLASFAAAAAVLFSGIRAMAADEILHLTLQKQVPVVPEAGQYNKRQSVADWEPSKTAIIICDVWDLHHSHNAVKRVGEFGPRLNEVVENLRSRGVTVIHAPSDCMDAYTDHAARKRAIETPKSKSLPDDIQSWCNRIPSEEAGVYPIDQSDGGDDDEAKDHAEWAAKLKAMGRDPGLPWKKQSDLIAIDDAKDFITDKGDEVWSILESRGITNVILAGVHTNMCVLGRPFGLRQMAKNGKNVVLLRDMTDTMYNPKSWPFVSHFTGTDLVISHVERHVCPTITSDQILGGKPFRFSGDKRPHVVLVLSEREYETGRTLTKFAADYLGKDFRCSFVNGKPVDGDNELPGLEALNDADVLLLSVRRRTLRPEQLEIVRKYIAGGKPAIGIRTASHAFSLLEGKPDEGRAEWPEFDAQVWGGHYSGHYGVDLTTTVEPKDAAGNPILNGVPTGAFASAGSLYKTSPLQPGATMLMTASVEGHPAEPAAWTFERADGGRSFYTSLGHKSDFENAAFLRMLTNAVYTAAGMEPPKEFEVVSKLEDMKRRWTPIDVRNEANGNLVDLMAKFDGPVWVRCGLRVRNRPAPIGNDHSIIWLGIGSYFPKVWLNGGYEQGCPGDGIYLPLAHIDPNDANLVVLRLDDVGDFQKFLKDPPRVQLRMLSWSDDPHEEEIIPLAGWWEVRPGDDRSWRKPNLPAKFALEPTICFEPPLAESYERWKAAQ